MKNKFLYIGFATFLILLTVVFTEGLSNRTFGQWFDTNKSTLLHSTEQKGNVSIVRRGVGYVLMEDVGLVHGDQVITSFDSTATLEDKNRLIAYLDENTQVSIENYKESIQLSFIKGNFFLHTQDVHNARIFFSYEDILFSAENDTLLSAEIFEGTQTIKVYKGFVEICFDAETEIVSAGEEIMLLKNEDGNTTVSYAQIDPIWLSAFLIEKLIEEDEACFRAEELNEILTSRQAETEEAQTLQKAHEEELLAQGGTVAVIAHEQPQTGEDDIPAVNEEVYTCTVQIRCDTILDNVEDLTYGKAQYVPDNGIILDMSKAEFIEGETVYDVLKRVCAYSGIDLSYDWTVQYGGYYIEAINHLFEFDCGSESGWMYKVNGWYPNYGCSNYILKDGDIIVWNYTCNLGKDVRCGNPLIVNIKNKKGVLPLFACIRLR